MLQRQDNLIIFLLLLIFIILFVRYLYLRFFVSLPQDLIDPEDPLVKLLETKGFSITQRKIRVPIQINKDEHEKFEARYYIDAVVRKDGFTYVVKIAKSRKPVEQTGPSIRDLLIPIYLLGYWDGLVYVDQELDKITVYTFDIGNYLLPKRRVFLPYLFFFILGVVITLLLT